MPSQQLLYVFAWCVCYEVSVCLSVCLIVWLSDRLRSLLEHAHWNLSRLEKIICGSSKVVKLVKIKPLKWNSVTFFIPIYVREKSEATSSLPNPWYLCISGLSVDDTRYVPQSCTYISQVAGRLTLYRILKEPICTFKTQRTKLD